MTKIEWTDETANFFLVTPPDGDKKAAGWACRKIGPDCLNCYAESMNLRNGNNPARRGNGASYKLSGFSGVEPYFDVDKLDSTLRWKKPRRLFPNDMTDMFLCVKVCRACGHSWEDLFDFDESCPNCSGDFAIFWPSGWITRTLNVFAVLGERGHTVQVLTKRPDRMLCELVLRATRSQATRRWRGPRRMPSGVWFGVSAGTQEVLDSRIRKPAKYLRRFSDGPLWLSAEPLLGPLDLEAYRNDLDWLVVGGESGRGARACNVEWIEAIVNQCAEFQIPVFVKQLGSNCYQGGERLQLKHPKGGDTSEWPEWPEYLRVRVPEARISRWQNG